MTSPAAIGPRPARRRTRHPDRGWRSWRALRLHALTGATVALFLALGRWQLHRALSGNELSWAYTVEWPLFAAVAVVAWWYLLHLPPGDQDAPGLHEVEVTVGGVGFDRLAYDRTADLLYLAAGDDVSDTEVGRSPEGHTIRLDQDGRLVALTMVGVVARQRRHQSTVVTIRRSSGDQQLLLDPDAVGSMLAAAGRR